MKSTIDKKSFLGGMKTLEAFSDSGVALVEAVVSVVSCRFCNG